MQARTRGELLNFKQEGSILQAGNRRKGKWYSETTAKGRWVTDAAYFEYGTEKYIYIDISNEPIIAIILMSFIKYNDLIKETFPFAT